MKYFPPVGNRIGLCSRWINARVVPTKVLMGEHSRLALISITLDTFKRVYMPFEELESS